MINLKTCLLFILTIIVSACNNSIHYPDGGYDYPKHVADKDTNFYYYPVRDSMSKNDSLFYSATYIGLQQFNEPNLSLQPLEHEEFRLIWGAPLGGFYILILTKNNILIKKQIISNESLFNDNKLTDFEKRIYNIIQYHYPYDDTDKYLSKYIDSLKINSPEILSPAHFIELTKKASLYIEPQKVYSTKIIKLNKQGYKHLITTINNSGYWKLPYSFKCEPSSVDGAGYSLEANTKDKYNFVTSTDCSENNKMQISFAKACQGIVNYAHMEKEIHIWSENMYKTDTAMVIQDVELEDINKKLQIKNLICRKKFNCKSE